MKKLVYVFVISLSLGVMSCGKDGDIGPEGPRGERGERGEKGETGADGTTILNGSTDPTGKEGSVGDFYLNTNSYVLFGPKTKDGWGKGESILGATGAKGAKGDKGDKGDKGNTGAKGDKGDTGARGAKGDKGEADYVILSGTIDPDDSIGKTGDFYLNRSSKTFFYRSNRKVVTHWQKVGNLASTIQFTKTGVDMPETSGTEIHFDFDLPGEVFEKSTVSVFVKRNSPDQWFPLPGYVAGNNIYHIYFGVLRSHSTRLYIVNKQVGVGDLFTNSTVRIIVTEADVFETVSKTVDFRNYDEVSRYFDLQE